jgi:Tfp pilus assembly protein PilE
MSDNTDEKKDPAKQTITKYKDESTEEAAARHFLSPSVNAAATIQKVHDKLDCVTTDTLTAELQSQMKHVTKGNLSTAESMLMSQAHTLDALFGEYSTRALNNRGNFDWFKAYMNMALRSQNQCRAAIQTLAEMKHPKPFIQNNKAQYQQVNNGNAPSHAHEENSKSSNELLEDKRDETEWLDTGTPQETGRDDKELETVGEKHRGKD